MQGPVDKQLRGYADEFRLLVDGVRDYAIFMLDPAGIVITWNTGAERLFGRSADEAISQPYTDFLLPEDRASGEHQRELEQAAASGSVHIKGWRVRGDGTCFWANGVTTALYQEDGGIRGFAKVTRDLTEKHRQDLLLQSVLDNSADAIVCINEQGMIEAFNQTAVKALGYLQSEVIGKNVKALMPEPFRSKHDTYLATYIQSGVAKILGFERVVEVRRKDGSTFPARLTVTEFKSPVDGSRHFTGNLRDLTEQRRLEAQLHQAQRMEAFGQLAGGVAHDFNNALTVIRGFSELLLSQIPVDDPKRESLQQIQKSGEHASALTRQLLAFSRRQVLEPRVLDINSIVRETELMLQRVIGEDIQLISTLAPDRILAKVDPTQIQQVIVNLAVNARHAMPQGGKLTIETQRVELDESYCAIHAEVRPGRFVLLAMTDTGVGMTKEVKTQIFEPFFTTKSASLGTGLGLAVVHGIVKQSGGSIEVYSEVGAGTTFKIYFPETCEPSAPVASSEPSGSAVGTETILLAEDEPSVRKLATLFLTHSGYTVIEATDGYDALRLADEQTERIDLLVTDVVMPGMSGTRLAEDIQSRNPGLKVLYLSGYADDAVVRHGILDENAFFLQKPFTGNSLTQKVRWVLDR